MAAARTPQRPRVLRRPWPMLSLLLQPSSQAFCERPQQDGLRHPRSWPTLLPTVACAVTRAATACCTGAVDRCPKDWPWSAACAEPTEPLHFYSSFGLPATEGCRHARCSALLELCNPTSGSFVDSEFFHDLIFVSEMVLFGSLLDQFVSCLVSNDML